MTVPAAPSPPPPTRKVKRAGWMPFGFGRRKPHHVREMLKIAWRNRGRWLYARRILKRGVCDGCALGTSGMRDWTLEGTHLCLVRLNLLELNTLRPITDDALSDVGRLPAGRSAELRALGRLAHPMRRRRGEKGFTRISWDEANAEIGARLRATDPARFVCFTTSRGTTNETYYAVQKAVRALGSPHVDGEARLGHSPSTSAMKRVLGAGASTCSYVDWYEADVIVLFGSNPAAEQPVALEYLYEAKRRGARVLVVNPHREPGLEKYWIPSITRSALFGSEIADRFFRVTTGGDLAFVQAVQKVLVERGALDRDFVREHTEGFATYVEGLSKTSFDELVRRSGASRDDVVAFAEEIAAAGKGVFVWGRGLTQHAHGTAGVEAVLALGLMKAFVGRPGCGLVPMRGSSGVQGGAEMGAYATAFPEGRPVTPEEASRLERVWGFRPPDRPGLDTVSMVEAAGRGEVDVFYQVGGNLLDALPQPRDVERALAAVPVRVHQDLVVTTPMLVDPADVVYLLPAKTRYEHDGGVTETTTERRVVFSPRVPGPVPEEAREEWRIAIDLAIAARPELAKALAFADAAAVRADIARTVPSYAGIETLALQGDQFQWGGRRLMEGGEFPLPGGRARFFFTEAPDATSSRGLFRLSTRRGKQIDGIVHSDFDALTGASRDHVFLCPDDMARLGLCQDDAVRVTSEHGRLSGRAFAAPIACGNAQMHWPEANALLAPGRVDPVSRVPDHTAWVRIEPLEPRIAVGEDIPVAASPVGAGA